MMTESENNKKTQPKKRKRSMVSHACQSCRASHFKCDGQNPCANCKKRNYECIYLESKRRGRKPNSKNNNNIELKNLKKELMTVTSERDYLKEQFLNQNSNISNEEKSIENQFIYSSTTMISQNIGPIYPLFQYPYERSYPSLQFFKGDINHMLDEYIGAFKEYTYFLFPYIEIPSRSKALQLITDFKPCSKNQKLEFIILNAVLSIGASIFKNGRLAQEFATTANILAKEVAFDGCCSLTAKSFSILAYLSLCQSDNEKADMYNNYALSVYNRLDNVNSQINATLLLNRILISKKSRVKRLLKIKNMFSGSEKILILIILFLKFYIEPEDIETFNGELEESLNAIKNEPEYLMLKIASHIVKAYEMKLKDKKQAIPIALESIEYIRNNKNEFQKFPFHFIKILSKLCGLLIDCNKIEHVELVLECIKLLAWETPRDKTIHHIKRKVRSIRTLHSNFKF